MKCQKSSKVWQYSNRMVFLGDSNRIGHKKMNKVSTLFSSILSGITEQDPTYRSFTDSVQFLDSKDKMRRLLNH